MSQVWMATDRDFLQGGPFQAVHLNQTGNLLVEYNLESDDTLELRGDVATGWDLSEDGTSYTFHIHPRAMWHDGVPVTAADVKWTLDSSAFPPEGEIRRWIADIQPFYKSSQVIDDKTVQVNTNFPAPAFLLYLAQNHHQMLPKHRYDGMSADDRKLIENYLGSGPFFLTDFQKDVSNAYERNPDYWKEGLPYLDGLEYFLIPGGGAMISAYKTGQVLMSRDADSGMSNAEALQVAQDMSGKAQVLWGGPMSQISLYLKLDKAPYDNVKVRQAMHLAIHRPQFIETLTLGHGTTGYPFPPNFWFSLTEEEVNQLPGFRSLNGEKHPDDIAEAQRLMAEAGFADGFKADFLSRPQFGIPEMVLIAADQLRRALKIGATLETLDIAAADAKRNAGDWEILPQSDGTSMHDPEDPLGRVYRSAGRGNHGGYENARIEELYDLQARSLDRDQRRAWSLEAANIILEEVPLIILYWADRPFFLDNSVKNFHMPDIWFANNFKMEHIWCDPVCS